MTRMTLITYATKNRMTCTWPTWKRALHLYKQIIQERVKDTSMTNQSHVEPVMTIYSTCEQLWILVVLAPPWRPLCHSKLRYTPWWSSWVHPIIRWSQTHMSILADIKQRTNHVSNYATQRYICMMEMVLRHNSDFIGHHRTCCALKYFSIESLGQTPGGF